MPRGKKPYFSPEQDIEIARRYQTGDTLQVIAESYGVSHVPVLAALKRQGVERRSNSDYNWQDTPESRAEIIRLWTEKSSVKDIARTVRTRDVNVSRVLREAGIEARLGGQHHRFSAAQTAVLVADFNDGASLAELVRRHGGNKVTVRDTLRRAGVNTTRKREKFWTPERDAWLIEQRQVAGRTIKSIADEIGYSDASVGIRLRRLIPVPHRQGENHHSWTGGRSVNAQGYSLVTPTSEEAALCPPMGNGYVLEHRLVMAKVLGRPLLPTETVHHIDNDKSNNQPSNLQLRQGNHGNGSVIVCLDCGSHNIGHVPIADPAPEDTEEAV